MYHVPLAALITRFAGSRRANRYGPLEMLRLDEVERPTPKEYEVVAWGSRHSVTRSDSAWRAA